MSVKYIYESICGYKRQIATKAQNIVGHTKGYESQIRVNTLAQ